MESFIAPRTHARICSTGVPIPSDSAMLTPPTTTAAPLRDGTRAIPPSASPSTRSAIDTNPTTGKRSFGTTRIPLSSSGSADHPQVSGYSWWAVEMARPRKESASRGLAHTLSLAPSANDAIMLSDYTLDSLWMQVTRVTNVLWGSLVAHFIGEAFCRRKANNAALRS